MLLSEEPALRELCRRYGERLRAEGWDGAARSATASTGRPTACASTGPCAGCSARSCSARAGPADEVGKVDELPDPFDPEQAERFVALLRSPFPGSEAPRIPRYLHALYLTRPDLQQFFPDLTGEGGNHFLWWAREKGERELRLPAELLPSVGDLYPPYDPYPKPTVPGVRLVGYLSAELGVGEAGRSMAAALQAAGEPYWPIAERQTWNRQRAHRAGRRHRDRGPPSPARRGRPQPGLRQRRPPADRPRPPRPPVRLAPLPDRHVGVGGRGVPRGLRCRRPTCVDEVWTYSRHAADALRAAIDKPVHTVPLPVVERRRRRAAGRRAGAARRVRVPVLLRLLQRRRARRTRWA